MLFCVLFVCVLCLLFVLVVGCVLFVVAVVVVLDCASRKCMSTQLMYRVQLYYANNFKNITTVNLRGAEPW